MGVASAGRGTKTNGRMLSALVKPPCEWMLGLRLLDSRGLKSVILAVASWGTNKAPESPTAPNPEALNGKP